MPMIDSEDFKEALAAFVKAKQSFSATTVDGDALKRLAINGEFDKLDQIMADKQAILQGIQASAIELANRVERLVELQS